MKLLEIEGAKWGVVTVTLRCCGRLTTGTQVHMPESIVFIGDTHSLLILWTLATTLRELPKQFTHFSPSHPGLGSVFRCHFRNRCTVPSAILVGQSTGNLRASRTLSANGFCPNGYSWNLNTRVNPFSRRTSWM